MAVESWDSRLPKVLSGCKQTVYRKKSQSKAVTLFLLHRDFWCNAVQNSKQDGRKKYSSGECTDDLDMCWNPECPPNYNGFIEGVAQVSPWLLEKNTEVYAKVEARYRLYRREVDRYDFEIDEVVFTTNVRLNPPMDAEHGRETFACAPSDLGKYSAELRLLYEKLGGPASSKVLQKENLNRNGVTTNKAFHNRHCYTIVPHTTATNSSGTPCHPYVTYNFPFRFEISSAPDSISIKSNKSAENHIYTIPKSRQELIHDAFFGFHYPLSNSDSELPSSPDDDDEMYVPRIRHPRQRRQVRRKDQRLINDKKQSYLDLFHADSYPWRPKPNHPPKAGIFWTVKVYATRQGAVPPDHKNTAVLNIRKLSYLTKLIALHNKLPQTITIDYNMLIGPGENTDAGLITLIGRLDKVVYAPGDPVIVSYKIHNSSNRVIQQLTIEVNQCTRINAWLNRVWRTTICRRQITAENATAQMPILPFTEQLIMTTRLNPWPVKEQVMHLFSDKLGTRRKCRVPIETEAFNIQMPKTPNAFYGIQQSRRYTEVPRTFILQKTPALSTLPGIIDCAMHDNLEEVFKPGCVVRAYPNTWDQDPHANCCCHRGPAVLSGAARTCHHHPPVEPYQLPVASKDNVHDSDEDRDPDMARINELEPHCAQCRGCKTTSMNPILINYEVVIHTVLRPQNTPDLLAQDCLLDKMQLTTGLMNDPEGEIEGKSGPRLSLPLIFALKCPDCDQLPPVANYDIDQRQDHPPRLPAPPQMWEPSQGKGLLTKVHLQSATCIPKEELLLAAMKV